MTGASQGSGHGDSDVVTVAYNAATGAPLWTKRYAKGNGEGVGTAIEVSPNGHRVYVAAATPQNGGVWTVLAYGAAHGRRVWVAHLSGPTSNTAVQYGLQVPYALRLTPDGHRVIVAGAINRRGGGVNAAVAAYRALGGDRVWVARYHGPLRSLNEAAFAIGIDRTTRAVYATGISEGDGGTKNQYGFFSGDEDYATLAFTRSTGQILWNARYDDGRHGSDIPVDVAVAPSGRRIFVTGSQVQPKPAVSTTLGYSAATGRRLWTARYRVKGRETWGAGLGVGPGGRRIYIAGMTNPYDKHSLCDASHSDCDFLTLAYASSTGHRLWHERYGSPGRGLEFASSARVGASGSRLYVSGTSADPPNNGDVVTIEYRVWNGTREWAARYNSSAQGTDVDTLSAATTGSGPARMYMSGGFTTCFPSGGVAATSCNSRYGTVSLRI